MAPRRRLPRRDSRGRFVKHGFSVADFMRRLKARRGPRPRQGHGRVTEWTIGRPKTTHRPKDIAYEVELTNRFPIIGSRPRRYDGVVCRLRSN